MTLYIKMRNCLNLIFFLPRLAGVSQLFEKMLFLKETWSNEIITFSPVIQAVVHTFLVYNNILGDFEISLEKNVITGDDEKKSYKKKVLIEVFSRYK
jgi:hypothetical protein